LDDVDAGVIFREVAIFLSPFPGKLMALSVVVVLIFRTRLNILKSMLIVVASLKLLGVEIIPFQVSVLFENRVYKCVWGGALKIGSF
jgi:hypothetical protein